MRRFLHPTVALITFAIGFSVAAIWQMKHEKRMLIRSNTILLASLAIPASDACVSSPQLPDATKTDQIIEVTLQNEDTFCEDCHDYKIILRKDGTATRIVLKTKEQHYGRFPTFYFYRLINLIEEQRYFELKDIYGEGIKDADVVETSVVRGNTRKTVLNIGFKGPVELFGIEMAIEGVASHIEWGKSQR